MNRVQEIEMREPVPSLELSALRWHEEDRTWTFIYNIETPVLLTSEPLDSPLFMTGTRSRVLIAKNPKNMINVPVSSIDDVVRIFDRQRESDLRFRELFAKEHPDIANESRLKTIVVANSSQNAKRGTLVSSVVRVDEYTTVLAGRTGV